MCLELSSGLCWWVLEQLWTLPGLLTQAAQVQQRGRQQKTSDAALWFPLMLRWVDPLFADGCSHRSRPVPSTCLGASDLLWSLTALLQSNFSLWAMRL